MMRIEETFAHKLGVSRVRDSKTPGDGHKLLLMREHCVTETGPTKMYLRQPAEQRS